LPLFICGLRHILCKRAYLRKVKGIIGNLAPVKRLPELIGRCTPDHESAYSHINNRAHFGTKLSFRARDQLSVEYRLKLIPPIARCEFRDYEWRGFYFGLRCTEFGTKSASVAAAHTCLLSGVIEISNSEVCMSALGRRYEPSQPLIPVSKRGIAQS
jgi:hypothetical protein